ncbi:MAG: HK97 family phage prohead protease [Pelagerythrobacter marensis]|nr:MAG: HK97 family phage prohead protease [Pelagerythrobacter marensis]
MSAPAPFHSAPLRFAGYAAIFNRADAARDTIRPGAFAATLAAVRDGPLPLCWQHNPRQVIGRVERAFEDARGLAVIGLVDPAARAARLLLAGALDGLSFGYRARHWRRSATGRELIALDLIEVSLVAQPLHPDARVHWIAP